MKCQKCGINDVNFRYTSNVNGNVTEALLCTQCASESGYNIEEMFNLGQMFNFGSMSMPMQMFNRSASPIFGGIMGIFPSAMTQNAETMGQGGLPSCSCGHSTHNRSTSNVEIDEKMSKRRELKMQMNAAVQNEEFERAAELRDMLKELEAADTERSAKCDSETD